MANEKKYLPITRTEYASDIRRQMGPEARFLSDDQIMFLMEQSNPEIRDVQFVDPRSKLYEPKDVVDGLVIPAKEQFYRLPETAASTFNILNALATDYDGNPEREEAAAFRKTLYEGARQFSRQLMDDDPQIRAYQQWASNNPFEWGKFLTDGRMFGSTVSSVMTSMGTVLAAAGAGGLVGGPVGAFAGGFSAGFLLESSEAYRSAYERAKELNYDDRSIDRITAEAGLWYGVISGVLESIVPLGVGRALGFGGAVAKQSFGGYASRFLLGSLKSGGRPTFKTAQEALEGYTKKSLSVYSRIRSVLPYTVGDSITESATELAQFLTQEAILDNRLEGEEITVPWIMEKVKSAEAQQSIAGGLIGGGTFGGIVSVAKASGNQGSVAAQLVEATAEKDPKLADEYIKNFLNDPGVPLTEKIEFSRAAQEIRRKAAADQVAKDIKAAAPKKEATEVKPTKPTKPTRSTKKAEPVEAGKELDRAPIPGIGMDMDLVRTEGGYGVEDPGGNIVAIFPTAEEAIKDLSGRTPIFADAKVPDKFQATTEAGAPTPTSEGETVQRGALDDLRTGIPGEIQKFVGPSPTKNERLPGTTNAQKFVGQALELFGPNPFLDALESLPEDQADAAFDLYARGVIELESDSNAKEALKKRLYDKDGNVKPDEVLAVHEQLFRDGFRVVPDDATKQRAGRTVTQGFKLGKLSAKEQYRRALEGVAEGEAAAVAGEEAARSARGEAAAAVKSERAPKDPIASARAVFDLPINETDGIIKRYKSEIGIILSTLKREGKISQSDVVATKKEAAKASKGALRGLLGSLIQVYDSAKPVDKGKAKSQPRQEQKKKETKKAQPSKQEREARAREAKEKAFHEKVKAAQTIKGIGEKTAQQLAIGALTPEQVAGRKGVDATTREIADVVGKPVDIDYVPEPIFSGKKPTETKPATPPKPAESVKSNLKPSDLHKATGGVNPDDVYEMRVRAVGPDSMATLLLRDGFIRGTEDFPVKVGVFPTSPKGNPDKVDSESGRVIEMKVEEALDRIIKAPGATKHQKSLAKWFRKHLTERVKSTRFVITPTKSAAVGTFTIKETLEASNFEGPLRDTITIFGAGQPSVYQGSAMKVILHEIAHAFTVDIINSVQKGYTSRIPSHVVKAVKEISLTRSRLKKYLENNPDIEINKDLIYGLKNDFEFIAEIFSNESFQKFLDGISNKTIGGKPEPKSLWQKMVDLIKRILGIDTTADSVLSTALTDAIAIFQTANERSNLQFSAGLLYDPARSLRSVAQNFEFENVQTLFQEEFDADDRTEDSELTSMREAVAEDPSAIAQRHFTNKFGIYLTDEQYAKMVEWMTENARNVKFGDPVQRKLFGERYIKFMEDLVEGENFREKIKSGGLTEFFNYVTEQAQRYMSKIPVVVREKQEDGSYKYKPYDPRSPHRLRYQVIVEPNSVGPPTIILENITATSPLGKTQPASETMNFVEYDKFFRGLRGFVQRLRAKDIFLHMQGVSRRTGKDYDFHKPVAPHDWELDAKGIQRLNTQLYQQWLVDRDAGIPSALGFFFAETSGDNAQLVFAKVPNSMMTQQAVEDPVAAATAYFDDILEKGHITKDQRNNFVESAKKHVTRGNPLFPMQLVGWHLTWGRIKGKEFMLREGVTIRNVAGAFKRLKLDLTEGVMPSGVGASSIMWLDPKRTEIRRNGKAIPLEWEGRSRNDGWLMTSMRYMRRIAGAVGRPDTRVFKTVIRDMAPSLDDAVHDDYISVKMLEATPFPGMQVYYDGKLKAEYNGETWIDVESGLEFDRLGTSEEVKDFDGVYAQDGVILPLPEHATRILQIHDKPKSEAAFPIVAAELLYNPTVRDGQFPEAQEFINELTSHIDSLGQHYLMDRLYKFREDPEALRKFVERDLQEGELPQELDLALKLDPSGRILLHPHFQRLVLPMLRGRLIVDGLYKMRNPERGAATHLHLHPRVDLEIGTDEFMISGNNDTMVKRVLSKEGITVRGRINAEHVEQANKILRDRGGLWMLVHRQPIQGAAKVQPRLLTEFTPYEWDLGHVVFFNEEDVFHLHEADFDGDTAHVEDLPVDLMRSWLEMVYEDVGEGIKREQFARMDKTVNLDLFKKGPLGNTLSNWDDVVGVIESNSKLRNSQGIAVNMKQLLARLSVKDLTIRLAGNKVFTVYRPDEEAVMNYWDIADSISDEDLQRLQREGDRIEGGVYITTKDHELAIILQAAVDNEKFGLLNLLTNFRTKDGKPVTLRQFLITRIVKHPDGSSQWTSAELDAVGAALELFSYSRQRSGRNDTSSVQSMQGIIGASRRISRRYFSEEKAGEFSLLTDSERAESLMEQLTTKIEWKYSRNDGKLTKRGQAIMNAIVSVRINGEEGISPVENILMLPYEYDSLVNGPLSLQGMDIHNAMMLNDDYYKVAHEAALDKLIRHYDTVIKEDLANSPESVKAGLALSEEMRNDFEEVMQKINKDNQKNENEDGEENQPEVRYEYNEAFAPFRDKYIPAVNNLDQTARRILTFNLLLGMQTAGRRNKQLRMLPDLFTLHGPTMRKYAEFYADGLYDPATMKDRAKRFASKRPSSVNNMLAQIPKWKKLRCS